MKRRTNHEGQPIQPTSQLTDAVDTAGQKRTHPKVRESKQDDYTVAQRADTTPPEAPWHGVQNPANPCKPAGAGEAQKKEGKGCRPTYATRAAVGQAPGDRKVRKPPRATCGRVSCASCRTRRKSTAQGREPSDAPKTPPTQQQGSTAGAGQATGARKVVEPPKGNLRQDTPQKTTGAPGRGKKSHTRRGSTIAYPTPSRRRERRHSSAASERTPHTHTGTTRDGGPQLKPTRLATAG